jgi:deoxyribodipyrimidine photo-lyase
MSTTILWFRQDLRLSDNPALAEAIAEGKPVIAIYLWAPEEEGAWAPGGATRWWLHHALADVEASLREAGSRLIIRKTGKAGSLEALRQLVRECGADAVLWNRRYEPAAIRRDAAIKKALREEGVRAESFNAGMLHEPVAIENKSGGPFKVFTPLWKHYQTLEKPKPVRVDLAALRFPESWPEGQPLASLELLPKISWDKGIAAFWTPTRAGAESRLGNFLRSGGAEAYGTHRDFPEEDGTSRLSPYLHFGQIGPREVWWEIAGAKAFSKKMEDGILRQLVWREFAHHLLYHFPETPVKPLREEFALFPWKDDAGTVEAWRHGRTGYPIVDAGMRQLWETGWMHNRVRMVVGSLLVKHLLQHWLEGARWFWDTLVDADLANNTLGWQWIGGCGADAAPYFRVFNPMIQGERFDSEGNYVRRYVPELAKVPARFIHKPWEAGDLELRGWGVRLGGNYPKPIIEHSAGRERALAAFASVKRG